MKNRLPAIIGAIVAIILAYFLISYDRNNYPEIFTALLIMDVTLCLMIGIAFYLVIKIIQR